jgi:hypothetical protein
VLGYLIASPASAGDASGLEGVGEQVGGKGGKAGIPCWSPLSPVTSTATLYTTETCIQCIQGSHKTTPFANWPTLTLSAEAILSLGAPPLTLLTVNQGPANPLIATHLAN